MTTETLKEIYQRDLQKLKEEISLYTNENDLWAIKPGISNSAGNLALHLIGNLKHFIGATLGNSGFIRERDKEFSLKNVPANEIITEIENTSKIIGLTLETLPAEDLEKNFPLELFGKQVRTDWMLTHLLTHLNYHLGQINYHRRLVS
jgi:uncharacterized damage-inducible protein DinB